MSEIPYTIGDIKYGHELGRKDDHIYIWHACIGCGKERWVDYSRGIVRHMQCIGCSHRKPHKPLITHTPVIGEIRKGEEIGQKLVTGRYIWSACQQCGRERWVRHTNGLIKLNTCKHCSPNLYNSRFRKVIITEPTLGEIRYADELTDRTKLTTYGKSRRYIWAKCAICNIPRWVQYLNGKPERDRCKQCYLDNNHTSNNPSWKGGRVNYMGYWMVLVQPDNKFYPMATKKGYILEHRYVMANHLDRCLHSWEVVHHLNSNRTDNRIENLKLLNCQGEHNTMVEATLIRQDKVNKTLQLGLITLMARVTLLEAENTILKEELNGSLAPVDR